MAKRRSPGEGSLFQRSEDKMWVGSMDVPTLDGKRRSKRVYSKTKTGAARKLRELRQAIASGNVVLTSDTTVARWLDMWLNDIQKPRVKPKTWVFYEQAARLYINPCVGDVKLKSLTPQHVRTMIKSLSSTRAQQRAHLVLRMALKAAVIEGLISRNVADAVDKPAHQTSQRTAMSLNVARALIQAAIELDRAEGRTLTPLTARWLAALLTGARKGELLGLEWDRVNVTDVDLPVLPARTIDISWQLQQLTKIHGCQHDCGKHRGSDCPLARWDFPPGFEYRECHRSLVWTRPKSKAGQRIVPLTWPLLPLLADLKTVDTSYNPHGLVWHHHDGRPISPKEDAKLWAELLNHAGLRHVPLHTLRHTTATLLHADHVSDEVRMQIMGQSSYLAHQAYVHVDTTQERQALTAYGSKLITPDDE